jgi:hypothetical protein
LLFEINEDRKAHGKKPFEDDEDDGNDSGDEGDNPSGNSEERMVKESTTDPESGMFHKGEKEKCFAYTVTTACDQRIIFDLCFFFCG